jgi:hypothetical protein
MFSFSFYEQTFSFLEAPKTKNLKNHILGLGKDLGIIGKKAAYFIGFRYSLQPT